MDMSHGPWGSLGDMTSWTHRGGSLLTELDPARVCVFLTLGLFTTTSNPSSWDFHTMLTSAECILPSSVHAWRYNVVCCIPTITLTSCIPEQYSAVALPNIRCSVVQSASCLGPSMDAGRLKLCTCRTPDLLHGCFSYSLNS